MRNMKDYVNTLSRSLSMVSLSLQTQNKVSVLRAASDF